MVKIERLKLGKHSKTYVLKCDDAFSRIETSTLFKNGKSKFNLKLKIELKRIFTADDLIDYCLLVEKENSQRIKFVFLKSFYTLLTNTYYDDLHDKNNVDLAIFNSYKKIRKSIDIDYLKMLREQEIATLKMLKNFKRAYKEKLAEYQRSISISEERECENE